MELNCELIKNNQYKQSAWSGGTTTEMFIYPSDSSYADRNFTWRISSASVDLDESTFTSLPDYHRILMVIKGKLLLNHEGVNPIELNELEQDSFDGGIATVSKGRVTDFNLMMKKGLCEGKVEALNIKSYLALSDNSEECKYNKFKEFTEVYYNIKGIVSVLIDKNKKIFLENKDLLIISRKNEKHSLLFELPDGINEEAILIKAKIFY